MTLDFNAGKYAPFVWPAYALTAIVIAGLVADSLARARRWREACDRAARREGAGP